MPTPKFALSIRQKVSSFFSGFCLSPKSVLLMSAGSILLILAIFAFFNTPDRRFEALCDSIFTKELCEDGLSLHYTLSNPEAYGVSGDIATFSSYNPTKSQGDYYILVSYAEELKSISPDTLSKSNQRTYDILLDYMEAEIAAYPYLHYDEPLSPTSGMQNQLPILLAEYSLNDKQDIDNYLCLLQSLPSYFDGLVTFEKEKAERGLFMSKDACRDTIGQCNTIITEDALEEGSHFLQTTFAERVTNLVDAGEITSAEMDAYIEANNQILLHTILPAYRSLAHNLTLLCNSGTNDMGLCYYPEGREYYEILVARQTGSSKTPDELMNAIKTSFMTDYGTFTEVANMLDPDNTNTVFSISEADKMLQDLEKGIWGDFPAYPLSPKEEMPSYEIKKVTPSMEEYLSPAFYLTPPLDDISENVIYINYGSSPEHLELYTTLAHEGYPGHLYQSVYSTLAWENRGVHPIRHLLHYGGYVEGYATYAEFYSYEYAKDFGNADYCELVLLNRKLHLALYSMLDISIHYYGATYEDAHETLCAFGIDDPQTTREIYDYIVNSPGNYLKYYVGYLEILECRELARLKWKDNYSDYNFHEFFLEFGPADFETIKDAIREYEAPIVPQELSMTDWATFPSPTLQCGWFRDDLHPVQEIPQHRRWT